MPKKPKINPEDLALFHKAMTGTKPLIQKKIRLNPRPAKKPVRKIEPEEKHLNFSESPYLPEVGAEEFIAYKHSSISDKTLRKLRKGQYNVEAVLDLHGMSVEEAMAAVDGFLQQCLHKGIRLVLIIHGKGHHSHGPVLKNKLNNWLREINVVLAFCSAAPAHGSRGAIYVLLKHSEQEDLA